MRSFVSAAALALLSVTPAFAQDAGPQTDAAAPGEDWSDVARSDILAAYRLYIENHPGVYDLANPGFLGDLAKARRDGLAEADEAINFDGYRRALARFSAALSDGHAHAYAVMKNRDVGEVRRWPGFVAAWRSDKLIAAHPDQGDPLNGATILSCDGQDIRPLLEERLLTQGFRPREAGQWWIRPSQLFYTFGETTPLQPSQCAFELSSGEKINRQLDWVQPTQEQRKFYERVIWGEAEPIGLTEPRDGIFMIAMQNFQPGEADQAAYEVLYQQIKERRDELREARAVVIDLRRNDGGSSHWSGRATLDLWGEEAGYSRYTDDIRIRWRASEGNAAHVADTAELMKEQGRTETAEAWAIFADGMNAARAAGQPLYEQPVNESDDDDVERVIVDSDFTTPVYVISWGMCASACLDALDYFTMFDNTRIIGAPTSADSTYMDIRSEELPSGNGHLVIPNKIWVGRSRGWGEIYQPDIVMDQVDWSTAAFLNRIEADLASR